MTPLEQMLRATAAEAAWPETPDLTTAVVERVQGRPTRRLRRGIRIGRPLAIALAALLVLAGAAVAIPALRNWLGLSSVEIKRVPRPLPAARVK